LETKIGLEILGNFTNETLEGGLADQEISRLLVLANLSKSHGSGTVTVGLLDTSGSGGGFAGSLGGKLLAGSLSSGRLAGSLKARVEIEEWKTRSNSNEINWNDSYSVYTYEDAEKSLPAPTSSAIILRPSC
jgi:hypothetical protein